MVKVMVMIMVEGMVMGMVIIADSREYHKTVGSTGNMIVTIDHKAIRGSTADITQHRQSKPGGMLNPTALITMITIPTIPTIIIIVTIVTIIVVMVA